MKYLLCKVAELAAFGFDGPELTRVTEIAGTSSNTEQVADCRKSIENYAEKFAEIGNLDIAASIYEAAVRTWKPYPNYMIEGLGDIERARKNEAAATRWFERCAKESSDSDTSTRCRKKITGVKL